jgi:hypothetical protein
MPPIAGSGPPGRGGVNGLRRGVTKETAAGAAAAGEEKMARRKQVEGKADDVF